MDGTHAAAAADGSGATTGRAERPWGEYEAIDEGAGFKVKRIRVHPGRRLSYQRHTARSEHWYLVSGVARVTLDGAELVVGPSTSVDVAAGAAHRVANVGDEDLVFIEVQLGRYLGEDDIERLADDYGRCAGTPGGAT